MDGNNLRYLPDGRNVQKRLKLYRKNSSHSEEGALAWERQLYLGPAAVDEERFAAAVRISAGEKGEQKDE